MRISDWSSDVCSSDLLVNGRRISGFGSVRNIPPEAIAKVEIFPEEVALEYGYAATERVVNFVLKPDFRPISVEAEAGIPTQGGQFKNELEPAFTIGRASCRERVGQYV